MIQNLIAGLLGVLFMSVALAKTYQKNAVKANIEFSFRKFLAVEWLNLLGSLVGVLIWSFMYGEVSQKYPQIEGLVKTSFVVMGAIGSWALDYFFGRTKVWIRNIVDHKTNIADGVEKSN